MRLPKLETHWRRQMRTHNMIGLIKIACTRRTSVQLLLMQPQHFHYHHYWAQTRTKNDTSKLAYAPAQTPRCRVPPYFVRRDGAVRQPSSLPNPGWNPPSLRGQNLPIESSVILHRPVRAACGDHSPFPLVFIICTVSNAAARA